MSWTNYPEGTQLPDDHPLKGGRVIIGYLKAPTGPQDKPEQPQPVHGESANPKKPE